ncbi:MAG: CYTH domain-containing protein, partial [Lachnospiraceae bacterium]|nr:CYTH domain-containing protein [Lachnospiraceae bacterium]
HHQIEQGYLCTGPVVRVRKQDDEYYLTYKGGGKMVREEYNLPLTAQAYAHLIEKADGHRITKTRYLIPLEPAVSAAAEPDACDPYAGLTVELDIFTNPGHLIMAEVEFETEEQALSFVPPAWFGQDVTMDKRYHNSHMSKHGITPSL